MFDQVYEKVNNIGGEITAAYKLRDPRLYDVKGLDKQRVLPAVQLLSATMAQVIRIGFPNDSLMLELADFTEKANNWFDVLNSNRSDHPNPLKCAFKLHLEKQTKALEEFRDIVGCLKIMWNRDDTMAWQFGVQVCICAILGHNQSCNFNWLSCLVF